MRQVERHVQQTGHRNLYSTKWVEDGRVGFSCEDCEDAHTLYQAWADSKTLPADSIIWKFTGVENRQDFTDWLGAIKVRGAWDLLVDDGFLDDSV